ncbi:MAG: PQQ-binding-like beta-propeller repeat protein, partial [Planctomycetota bacterium]
NLLAITAVTLFLCALHPCAGAEDKDEEKNWAPWRGPNHDGISEETDWNPEALKGNPKVVWKANVGKGWSTACIQGPHLFTMGNTGDRESVYCLDALTGEEVWKHTYDCPAGDYPGPRSTPVWDDNRVYTLSRNGHLFCLDAKKGRVVWKRNLLNELKAKNIKWGLSCAVRVEGRAVLVNAGKTGMSFDKKSGKVFWAKIGKKQCVALFSEKEIVVVDFRTGRRIWGEEWITSYDVNAADPVVTDKKIFISSGYGRGCALFDFSRGRFQKVWENKDIASHFGSAVIMGDHVYAPHGNTGRRDAGVKCMELKTGKTVWENTCGFCSLVATKDKLIILNEQGELFIAKADPSSYQEISRCTALPGRGAKCWNMPVLCRGRIYCRNSNGDMVCLDATK